MPQKETISLAQRVSPVHKRQNMKLSEVLETLDEKASMAQLYKLYNQAMKAVPGSKKHKELRS